MDYIEYRWGLSPPPPPPPPPLEFAKQQKRSWKENFGHKTQVFSMKMQTLSNFWKSKIIITPPPPPPPLWKFQDRPLSLTLTLQSSKSSRYMTSWMTYFLCHVIFEETLDHTHRLTQSHAPVRSTLIEHKLWTTYNAFVYHRKWHSKGEENRDQLTSTLTSDL